MAETPEMNTIPEVHDAVDQQEVPTLEDIVLHAAVSKELGLEPKDLEIGLEVARNKLNSGAPEEALRLYGALVLCDPVNVQFQIGLANCAIHVHEYHLALQAASVVIALDTQNPIGYFLSGSACMFLGHLDEAVEDLTDAARHALEQRDAKIKNEADAMLRKVAAMRPGS